MSHLDIDIEAMRSALAAEALSQARAYAAALGDAAPRLELGMLAKAQTRACAVPLSELLASVPEGQRAVVETGRFESRSIPWSRYCREAAEPVGLMEEIERLAVSYFGPSRALPRAATAPQDTLALFGAGVVKILQRGTNARKADRTRNRVGPAPDEAVDG